jgi:SAM-dependent methyltransferase
MKLTNFRWSRPITSYAAVQSWVASCIRNSYWQTRSTRISKLQYLDLGCGQNTHDNFINLDYYWHPKIDVCWDISRGIPFPSQSLRGVFTEHCLEYLPLPIAEAVMREIHRVLVPGGRVRIILPDAEIYLTRYTDRLRQCSDMLLPFEAECAYGDIVNPILAVNRIFYQDRDQEAEHQFIYDASFLCQLLSHCGFSKTMRTSFMNGADKNLPIDNESRVIESFYVEAIA